MDTTTFIRKIAATDGTLAASEVLALIDHPLYDNINDAMTNMQDEILLLLQESTLDAAKKVEHVARIDSLTTALKEMDDEVRAVRDQVYQARKANAILTARMFIRDNWVAVVDAMLAYGLTATVEFVRDASHVHDSAASAAVLYYEADLV